MYLINDGTTSLNDLEFTIPINGKIYRVPTLCSDISSEAMPSGVVACAWLPASGNPTHYENIALVQNDVFKFEADVEPKIDSYENFSATGTGHNILRISLPTSSPSPSPRPSSSPSFTSGFRIIPRRIMSFCPFLFWFSHNSL